MCTISLNALPKYSLHIMKVDVYDMIVVTKK
jgi:hypothetical protein